MIKKVKSCGVSGMDGFPVIVEVDISNGMPSFDIVGLPDAAVKESRERIRSAIKNSNFDFPQKRITVNLAPAAVKKEGAVFDLPIAIGILLASEQIPSIDKEFAYFGELSLDGVIRPVSGVLPMVLTAFENGIESVFVSEENSKEAAIVGEVNVFSASTLYDVVCHLRGDNPLYRATINIMEYFEQNQQHILDFADVKGQEAVKRALEISASGGHNALMIGPPGSGKTMMAQRLPGILPDLSVKEALEVTKIYSIAGLLEKNKPIITTRPFRSPHHTVSPNGLSGGGVVPKPGEISLAHNGVLFLDELPEFTKTAMEVLRQPLEDGKVTVARVSGTYTFPCNTMFIASMNPCKCGYFGDETRQCTCTSTQIQGYLGKISGPMLDRIDLHIEVSPVRFKAFEGEEKPESSEKIKERVNAARKIQQKRFENENIFSNSQMLPSHIEKYCKIDEESTAMLKNAFNKLGLSARAYNRILKVSRTIADMDQEENIKIHHIAEAIQYRALDRKYWM